MFESVVCEIAAILSRPQCVKKTGFGIGPVLEIDVLGCWSSEILGTTGHSIDYIDGLVQDCSNSSALAMELLLSCAKPSISHIGNATIGTIYQTILITYRCPNNQCRNIAADKYCRKMWNDSRNILISMKKDNMCSLTITQCTFEAAIMI